MNNKQHVMKKSILLVMMIAVLSACGNNKKAESTSAEVTETSQAPDMHTAANSLDYYGIYKGTLPAADCPGIETTITINPDSTITVHGAYLERNSSYDDKGTYTLDGSILTMKQEDGSTTYYKVEEGQIRMLNADKQPVTGDLAPYYILKKE